MPLTDYARSIHSLLADSPHVASVSLSIDERTTKAIYLRGTVVFVDRSVLRFREFLVADPAIRKIKYAYHWSTLEENLLFRYDNAADVAARSLRTFPHHKHTPSGIHEAEEPTLAAVLNEIGRLVRRT